MKWREFDTKDWSNVSRHPPRLADGADFGAGVVEQVGVDLDDAR